MTVDPLDVAAWRAPVHSPCLRLTVFWDGVTGTDESAWVDSAAGIETYDPALRRVHGAQVTLTLDNSSGRYDPDSAASPLHPYLTHAGQRATLEMGWNGRLTLVGTYWVKSLTPPDDRSDATMVMEDRIGHVLEQQVVSWGPAAGLGLDAPVRGMLTAAGMTEGVDFTCDAATTTLVYGSCTQAKPLDELAQVCLAEDGRLYADPAGVVRWEAAAKHHAKLLSPVVDVLRSESAYQMSRKRPAGAIANRVVIDYQDRYAATGAPEAVFTLANPIRLAASTPYSPGPGLTWWSAPRLLLGVRALVAGELRIPADAVAVSAVTANTAADGSGTAVTVTAGVPTLPLFSPGSAAYCSLSFSGTEGTVALQNCYPADVWVTSLVLSGKASRTAALYRVIVDDAPSQAAYGAVVELVVRSNWMPDVQTAQQRASDHMHSLDGLAASVDLPAVDGMPWLHAQDSILVTDDRDPAAVGVYYLQATGHSWKYDSGGYLSAVTAVPGLPTTQQVVYTLLPAATASAAGVASAGPWLWDTMAWSQGAWS